MCVFLLILVTGNRQMEVPALRPGLHCSSSSATRCGSSGPCSGGNIQSMACACPCSLAWMHCPQGLGETGWQNRPAPTRCRAAVLPTLTSVRTVLPLLVLLVFLYLVGTLRAEPLHLFWRSSHDSHTGPRQQDKFT